MNAQTPYPQNARPSLWDRAQLAAWHGLAAWSLRGFEGRLASAPARNVATLHSILSLNAGSDFGRAHRFKELLQDPDPVAAFRAQVPLSRYSDYAPYVARIAAGEAQVLTTDPVHMLAGSSGTTDRPKRIPRTRRAQRHHLQLAVLAEQAVLAKARPASRRPNQGINLMSCYASPAPDTYRVPVLAGPNVGMARMRPLMPLLWCAPPPVYEVADPVAAQYLHALFALRYSHALYIQAPFAPQVVAWMTLIQQRQAALIDDLRTGHLAGCPGLPPEEKAAIEPYLRPEPARAAVVAEALGQGPAGLLPRLWPDLQYVWAVSAGSFALSLPRLRQLCGPDLLIQSGCHAASEGVVGISLRADGIDEYVLAVGAAYFEFLPLSTADAVSPVPVDLPDLRVGTEYELVLTSCAGLYRYRLGDVIRITGWAQATPTFEFLYRRGTLVNLVGEKTSEFHTAEAIRQTVALWTDGPAAVHEYTVAANLCEGIGRYTFYVELAGARVPGSLSAAESRLDEVLGSINPYYQSSGRRPGRLAPATLKIVRPGTFAALLDLQRHFAAPVTATQVKVPRLVTRPDQVALLESQVLASP